MNSSHSIDKLHNFDGCEIVFRDYGGSDRKFGIRYNGEVYMLKFSEKHEKKDDFTTSYLNKPTSEYISSHIANAIGVLAHETILGVYGGEIAVACKDFRGERDRNIDFREILRSIYDAGEIKKIPKLHQIYEGPKKSPLVSDKLYYPSIEHYWDTFILDALVGNFDRHIENWGYVANDYEMKCSPVYDLGSTLFPQIADEGIRSIIDNPFEIGRRCFIFPSPALHISYEKTGKVGYYDFLSSNYDEECTKALLKIVPNIDMSKIYDIIDKTPIITDVKKDFYKVILTARKQLILDRAYEKCSKRDFDDEAYLRIAKGTQFSDELLRQKMASGEIAIDLNNMRLLITKRGGEGGDDGDVSATPVSKTAEPRNTDEEQSPLVPQVEELPSDAHKLSPAPTGEEKDSFDENELEF